VTPAGEILRDEIRRSGPVSFRRFMETALYHPEAGYYRRRRDPFGKDGDFFTAEQVQPVFGILMAAAVRGLRQELGEPADFSVVELGAGREEMAPAFGEFSYLPVDVGYGALPAGFRGVVFCNEFFDALPVETAVFHEGFFYEQLVGLKGDRLAWTIGAPVREQLDDYLRRYYPAPDNGNVYEANLDALAWIERIARSLTDGYVLTVDYGYTRAEWVRFPLGTLMGYRRHTAREDVLEEPGARDITAHVNFTALEEYGAACGLERERFETLARTLLDAGEPDQFAEALEASTEAERWRRRMQLKTLLFGMGETFRTLLQRKARK